MKFDKLKIVFPVEQIEVKNGFRVTLQDGVPCSESFRMIHPCYVSISANRITEEARIEFTGKVLRERYTDLISHANIRHCLEAINGLGVCLLNVDAILKSAKVERCDVTKDVVGIDLKDLKTYITTHIRNHNKWVTNTFQRNDNIQLKNNVQKKEQKKTLTIYDKCNEIQQHKNQEFLRWAGDEVLDAMHDKVRFELTLPSYSEIKKTLVVTDNRLMTVLHSTANPIRDMMTKALRPDSGDLSFVKKWTVYKNQCIMEHHGWDLMLLEIEARKFCGKNFNQNIMEPFRRLVDERNRKGASESRYNFHTLLAFDDVPNVDYPPVTADYWRDRCSPNLDMSSYDFIKEY